MEKLNKLKSNGKAKTTFELAVEILQNNLDFDADNFLEFAKEIQSHFIEHHRKQRSETWNG